MSGSGFMTGFFTVAFVVIVGWAFARKPAHYVPTTLRSALLGAIFIPPLAMAMLVLVKVHSSFDIGWMLGDGVGLLIGYIIVNAIVGHQKPSGSSAPAAEPDDSAVYHEAGEPYRQPPTPPTTD